MMPNRFYVREVKKYGPASKFYGYTELDIMQLSPQDAEQKLRIKGKIDELVSQKAEVAEIRKLEDEMKSIQGDCESYIIRTEDNVYNPGELLNNIPNEAVVLKDFLRNYKEDNSAEQ
ncbi:hypothetical protein HYW74_00180 [Candidatus Pacearchaeota archaeon]|nr:hypothetical protein [Candidatus Pacearchaeota archaeon]